MWGKVVPLAPPKRRRRGLTFTAANTPTTRPVVRIPIMVLDGALYCLSFGFGQVALKGLVARPVAELDDCILSVITRNRE